MAKSRLRPPELPLAPTASRARDEHRVRESLGLTPTQAIIACDLAEGLTYEEIAARRHISPLTVHTHVKTIHAIAEVTSSRRLAAVIHAILMEGK